MGEMLQGKASGWHSGECLTAPRAANTQLGETRLPTAQKTELVTMQKLPLGGGILLWLMHYGASTLVVSRWGPQSGLHV